jgi:DNA-binding response OmpR family regulator
MKIKLGIIGAMSIEVASLKSILKPLEGQNSIKEQIFGETSFFEGLLEGLHVVIVQSGIGKVNAALCAQRLISDFSVTHIINTGIAGAMAKGLKVLDFVDLVITKPFSLNEFLCSLSSKTLLPKVRHKECITFMEYTFYPVTKEIITPSETIKLTEKEVIILKYLYNRAPEIISKEELLKNVWGYSTEMTTHTIETHIYRLRQKVEQNGGSQIIITENSGYRINI